MSGRMRVWWWKLEIDLFSRFQTSDFSSKSAVWPQLILMMSVSGMVLLGLLLCGGGLLVVAIVVAVYFYLQEREG